MENWCMGLNPWDELDTLPFHKSIDSLVCFWCFWSWFFFYLSVIWTSRVWEEGQASLYGMLKCMLYAVLTTQEPLKETLAYAVPGHRERWMASFSLSEEERGKDDLTCELLGTLPRSN